MTRISCVNLGGTGGSMVGYLHEDTPETPNRKVRPVVIICPGGGYEFLSDREKDPPALFFFAKGYNVFILAYSVRRPGDKPLGLAPLTQLSAAVMEVRKNHEDWHCAADQIAVCGFSAGGQLAASLGTLWNSPELRELQDTKGGENRPNAMILCYPVISSGEKAHEGSIRALAEDDPKLRAFFSLENQASSEAPPTFLWHTMEDDGVPAENSILMAAALHASRVPVECHLFQRGGHGLSVCSMETGRDNPQCASWLSLCVNWMNVLFHFEA